MKRRKKKCTGCAAARRRRKSSSRRRSGMYGVGKTNLPIMQVATMGAGAIAAKMVDPLLLKIPVKQVQDDSRIRDGIKTALGVFLATQKNEMLANAGLGMAAYGLASLVGGFLPQAPASTTVGGLSPNSRYQMGTGPMNMAGLGPQQNYNAIQGVNAWDGVGTEPDAIYGGYSREVESGGLKVV